MKKIVSIAMIVMMLCAFSTVSMAKALDDDDSYTLSAVIENGANIVPGDEFTVKVYFLNDDGESTIDITGGGSVVGYNLFYDTEKVTFVNCNIVSYLPSDDKSVVNSTGKCSIVCEFDSNISISKDEPVATYTFKVNDGLTAGTYGNIFSFTVPSMYDNDTYAEPEISTDVTGASITVKAAGPTTVKKEADFDKQDKITVDGKEYAWDDATIYLVSAAAEDGASKIECVVNATYKLGGVEKTKDAILTGEIANIVTENAKVSFRAVILNTDKITDLALDGEFTFTK